MTAPSGCAHCGLHRHVHGSRWTAAAGWHHYTLPTQEQIKERMLARQAEQEKVDHAEEG